VKLHQIERVELQILQTLIDTAHDVVVGKHFAERDAWLRRPEHVLGRDFAGDIDALGSLADDFADKFFTVAVAISQRRINEVQAEIDGPMERFSGFVIVGADPLGAADAPSAIADLADFKICSAQFAVSHLPISLAPLAGVHDFFHTLKVREERGCVIIACVVHVV
jgi:hypothetical protein